MNTPLSKTSGFSDRKPIKALVTGGAGFLGLYIVEQLLARGDSVRVLCRNSYPVLNDLGVETVQGNIIDRNKVAEAVSGCSVVFHTAGLPGIRMQRRPFYETNVVGTQNIIDACLKFGVERLIYTSSPSVTVDGKPQLGIDESTPYPKRFLGYYSETKALAEEKVLQANGLPSLSSQKNTLHDQNISESGESVEKKHLLTCSLRPRVIWGPRDRHLIPRLLDRAKSGRLRRVGDGTNMMDMIYVENAATAHIQACDALLPGSPVCGNAYYLSQGKPVNCWQWVDEMLELAGLPKVKKSLSFKTAYRIGAVLEFIYKVFGIQKEPLMTRFLATQLGISHWFDISKAQRDFGYVPIISTDEGMRRLATELFSHSDQTFPIQ